MNINEIYSLNDPSILAELAESDDALIRQAVASNRNTSVETLTKLSGDSISKVVSSVVGNPKTPEELIDEPDFDVLATLIDAESRGSTLAKQLREFYLSYDDKIAEEIHKEIQSTLVEMESNLSETLGNYDEDEQREAFDDFYANQWYQSLFDSYAQGSLSPKTYQLIFDELNKSIHDSGPFGNSDLLEDAFGWTNEMNLWGFLLSPFVPRNVLRSMVGWNHDSNNYMSSIAVSPVMSQQLLRYVADEIIPISGGYWIGVALLVNANSDLYVLNSLSRYGAEIIARGYCEFPTTGGGSQASEGVCGPLVGKFWFASEEVFDTWSEDDLIGPLSEDAPETLQNFVKIATLYLSTPHGSGEINRDKLASSELFGNLLIAMRMIDEFKFGRTSVESEVNSDSYLIRSVLYWNPGLDPKIREALLAKGPVFPQEVGDILAIGWTENISLIF